MGRYCLIVLLAFGAGCQSFDAGDSKTARAPEDFAAQEFDRYAKRMGLNLKAKTRIDPQLAGGKDAYSISSDETGFTITATDRNLALRGIYHVLDRAGCRFLAPQFDFYKGSAEYVPAKNSPIIFSGSMTFSPQLKFRKLYVEEGHSHTPENLAQMVEWMPKVGFNTLVVPTNYQGAGKVMWDNFRAKVAPECQKRGITIEVGGHGYQNFINTEMEDGKLFEKHPEYFGADAKGTRLKAKGRVFCTSNSEAVQYLIGNLLTYVKDRPEIQIYDLWPPDGAKWCECDECKKLGTPPDRQAILMSQVKEATAKVRPDLRLEMIAYAAALQPPKKARVDKDILVDFCPIGQEFDRQINDVAAVKNAEYVSGLTAWRKAFEGDISIYSYYRKYAWESLPVIIPHYMQKDLQWYATVPVQGVSSYAEPDDWQTYELNHYVLAALAWDVNADVDALVKKFCDARYGKASDTAVKAFATLEDVTRKYSSIPNISMKSADETKAASARIAETKDAVAAANLKALGLMLQYAALDLEIQHIRATGGTEQAVRDKATALQKFVAENADAGVFMVKDKRLSLPRVLARYGIKEQTN